MTPCCKCSGPNARCISCKCCQEKRACVNCIPGERGKCVNILNLTSSLVTGPVKVGEQPSRTQKSSPPEVHRQPVLLSSRFSSTSHRLPTLQLPSSISVSQQKSRPNPVPEPPQMSLNHKQKETCVVVGCTRTHCNQHVDKPLQPTCSGFAPRHCPLMLGSLNMAGSSVLTAYTLLPVHTLRPTWLNVIRVLSPQL